MTSDPSSGRHYRFSDTDLHPGPAAPIPVWYCGSSAVAARRAAGYCDGFMSGRITLQTHGFSRGGRRRAG